MFLKLLVKAKFVKKFHSREKQEFVRIQELVTTESWLLIIDLFDMFTQAIKFYKSFCFTFQRIDV